MSRSRRSGSAAGRRGIVAGPVPGCGRVRSTHYGPPPLVTVAADDAAKPTLTPLLSSLPPQGRCTRATTKATVVVRALRILSQGIALPDADRTAPIAPGHRKAPEARRRPSAAGDYDDRRGACLP